MIPVRPLSHYLRRLAGPLARPLPDFWQAAEEVWTLEPGEEHAYPAAIFLPGQLDRIERTVFDDHPATLHAFTSGDSRDLGPTLAARFRDVTLFDGVLYKGSAVHHLRARQRRLPLTRISGPDLSGSLYDSWIGLRYFGNWLMDDCETYRLAEQVGRPVTIRPDSSGHRADYEARLSMAPQRVQSAHFDELVLFRDLSNNAGRRARAADRRRRLTTGVDVTPHPGVFLLRGSTGDPRLLKNESALAERLWERRGIAAFNAETRDVEGLIKACAGARLVIGVEGSQLTHALAAMAPGGTMVGLFPPDRVTAAMKLMTDRLDMHFALVIGAGGADGFTVDADEVEATLDLLP